MSTRNPSRAGTRTFAIAAVLAVSLGACGGGTAETPSSDAAASPPAEQSAAPVPTMPPGDGQGAPQAVIDTAVADASARAGVDPAQVTVVTAESVTFPNGGLGCPEPGMMYTDVLTPGYRVVVEAGGRQYDYRASARGGAVRWCENPPAG